MTAQIESVAGDIEIHATKIGMLATAAIVEAVAAAIRELELPLVVVDPVLVSTSGERLLDSDGVQTLCTELLPLRVWSRRTFRRPRRSVDAASDLQTKRARRRGAFATWGRRP